MVKIPTWRIFKGVWRYIWMTHLYIGVISRLIYYIFFTNQYSVAYTWIIQGWWSYSLLNIMLHICCTAIVLEWCSVALLSHQKNIWSIFLYWYKEIFGSHYFQVNMSKIASTYRQGGMSVAYLIPFFLLYNPYPPSELWGWSVNVFQGIHQDNFNSYSDPDDSPPFLEHPLNMMHSWYPLYAWKTWKW